ncbi:lipocalin family protein [Flavobacterium sp.]|uniref:lipocalin family protein n=1 Tax=Flavobacterium sp. TaxID=239 RepID=UPI001B69EF06|nr:lipocalin family protein [Flavobacterium sp.]MBP6127536.1 lipocalin family protein [Flavobacterium sp.]
MRQLILVLSFLFFNYTFSQDFIGTWKVKEISDSKETEAIKKMFSDIFLNSEFTFTNDNKFQFVTSNKSRASHEFAKGLSSASWILNEKTQRISIGSKKNNYTILGIFYKEIDGIMYFQLHEFNYVFKMEKVVKE